MHFPSSPLLQTTLTTWKARSSYAHAHALCQFRTRRFHSPVIPDNQKFNILFLGRDEFSAQVLQELHSARDVWEDITIATQSDQKRGKRGAPLIPILSPLETLAQTLSIPVHHIPPKKPDFKHWLPPPPFYPLPSPSSLQPSPPSNPPPPPPNHLLLTASFGRILTPTHLSLFHPHRRLNVHPSLLPLYRGAAPIQHALLRGESETGVCVIEMMERAKGIDAGGVWGCVRVPIPKETSFAPLRDTLAREGGKLLVSVLRDMLAGKATLTPQPQNCGIDVPRAPSITTEDSIIDFKTMTAEDIMRRYRAIGHQRPLVAFLPSGKSIQLFPASPSPTTPTPSPPPSTTPTPGLAHYIPSLQILQVRCADGSILDVSHVKQEGRALLAVKQWWVGVKPQDKVDGGVHFKPSASTAHTTQH